MNKTIGRKQQSVLKTKQNEKVSKETALVAVVDEISEINKHLNDTKIADAGAKLVNEEVAKEKKEVNRLTVVNEQLKNESDKQKAAYEKEIDRLKSKTEKLKNECEKQKSTHERDVEKLKTSLERQTQRSESESRETSKSLREALLDVEITKARLSGEVQVKEAKINCQNHTIKMYDTELNSIQSRFERKCDEVEGLENRIKTLKDKYNQEISGLETVIKELKCELMSKKSATKEETARPGQQKVEKTPKPTQTETGTSPKPQQRRQNELPKESQKTYVGKKYNKNAVIIGTSNTKYLSAKFIGGTDMFVKKALAYSISDAKTYVNNFEGVKPDLVAYQVTCNDVETKSPDEIVTEMDDLIQATNTSFGEKPVVVSLPLPRKEPRLNDKAQQITMAITAKLSAYKNVSFSNNNNLLHRGRPIDGVLYDKKHLSKWGIDLLAKNLKTDIRNVLNSEEK